MYGHYVGKGQKGLKDGATLSMEKIEEYTKIGKLKIEEMAAKRKIARNFIDIGERPSILSTAIKGPRWKTIWPSKRR